jgi:hypothetical protein
VGDGELRDELAALAESLGIADAVVSDGGHRGPARRDRRP